MSIYLMSTINPPKRVIDRIHRILAKFFLGHISGVKGKNEELSLDPCIIYHMQFFLSYGRYFELPQTPCR